MPLRLPSDMLPTELVEWQRRHRHSPILAADALGITRRQFDRMVKGDSPITLTIERLCDALDRAETMSLKLARICADSARKL